jgi:hypothetical protein
LLRDRLKHFWQTFFPHPSHWFPNSPEGKVKGSGILETGESARAQTPHVPMSGVGLTMSGII